MEESAQQEIPFDMSKETLKTIRGWIDKIAEISVGIISGQRINPNEMIVLKYKMVNQLIVLSAPLLDTDLEEVENFFSEIKLDKGSMKNAAGIRYEIKVYSTKADENLNECVKGIEKALKKYFIPTISEGERY